MGYIDFHSHILPEIDDGASNLEISLGMAREYLKQGVDTVFCTPHYYHGSKNSVEDFLKRRKESYDALKRELERNSININLKLGAEVNFNCDLSELSGIERLAYEDSDYILIEMPFCAWQDGMFDYIYKLSAKKKLTPVIAHIERYAQDEKTFKKLEGLDVLFQVNASSFLHGGREKRNAVKLLKTNKIHVIGTDAHNLTVRPPEMKAGFSYIKRKMSEEYTDYLKENGRRIMNNEEVEKSDAFYGYGYFYPSFLRRFFK